MYREWCYLFYLVSLHDAKEATVIDNYGDAIGLGLSIGALAIATGVGLLLLI